LERACHGKIFSSNDPVFVTLHPESSKSRLIREMHGSSLECACHGFYFCHFQGSIGDLCPWLGQWKTGGQDATVVKKPLMPSKTDYGL
jgi:hypothetical protein